MSELVGTYLFIYVLFRNLVKPSEIPRPLAFTGITMHTKAFYIK